VSGEVQRWRDRPRDPAQVRELLTVRYRANLTGQAYRDQHAALLYVARQADPDAETTEALFEGHGLVLVVRYLHHRDEHPPAVEYVTVEPGHHLYYSQEYDSLGEETDGSLDHWYVPVADGPPAGGEEQ
jgi:hypothetical protein